MPLNASEDVPAELWMGIFESMSTPADLYSVVRTCRAFYTYAIRPLHRHLIWKDALEVARNLPLWDDKPQMWTNVETLRLEVSTMPEYQGGVFVNVNGDEYTIDHVPQNGQFSFTSALDPFFTVDRSYASQELYDRITHRIATFSHLSEFTCKHILITDRFFSVIHTLPALRKLHVENCILPARNAIAQRDHSVLPITDLTLLNLRRRGARVAFEHNHGHVHAQGHAHNHNQDDDAVHVLNLARAQNLRTLRVDTTADVFGRVFYVFDQVAGDFVYNTPANLTKLYIDRRRLVTHERSSYFHNEANFPDRNVYGVISHCPTLRMISISQPFPQHTPFPSASVGNMTCFEGLPEGVLLATHGKQMDAISILWSDLPSPILDTLAHIANQHPALKMLAIECGTWDDEIIIAISQLFKQLRRLKITYQRGGPQEVRDFSCSLLKAYTYGITCRTRWSLWDRSTLLTARICTHSIFLKLPTRRKYSLT